MYTSIVCLALTGLVAPAAESPVWTSDYGAAYKRSAHEKRPMAIFIASGKEGYRKVSEEGKLNSTARRLLAERYICVYLNVDTKKGKELAHDFEMSDGLGIVISDSTGENQAFRHEGDLSPSLLNTYLERYSDPNRVARFTDTNAGKPAVQTAPAPVTFPAFGGGFGGFGGFGGGGCST